MTERFPVEKIAFLDCEATHISGEVIEISIVDIFGDTLFHTLCKPVYTVSKHVMQLTGITNTMLARRKHFNAYYGGIQYIIKNKIIVAYEIESDFAFMYKSLIFNNISQILSFPYVIDAARIAKKLGYQKIGLAELADRYHYGISQKHRSSSDCKMLRYVFLAMLGGLPEEDVNRLLWNVQYSKIIDPTVPVQTPKQRSPYMAKPLQSMKEHVTKIIDAFLPAAKPHIAEQKAKIAGISFCDEAIIEQALRKHLFFSLNVREVELTQKHAQEWQKYREAFFARCEHHTELFFRTLQNTLAHFSTDLQKRLALLEIFTILDVMPSQFGKYMPNSERIRMFAKQNPAESC